MNNDLNDTRCFNQTCFHLDHRLETKPEIGLLNTIVDRLEQINFKFENLDRKVNYTVYRIFALQQELTQIQEKIVKVNSDLQRILTLERVLTILLNR